MRLWFPQLDVFDCIRRMSALLAKFDGGVHTERLYILDFYLANPPLLYQTTMTAEVRAEFRKLKIKRPEKAFTSFPAPQILFHKMEPVQREGLSAMVGKGLVAREKFERNLVELSSQGSGIYERTLVRELSSEEQILRDFLVFSFGIDDGQGLKQLRLASGLRRAT